MHNKTGFSALAGSAGQWRAVVTASAIAFALTGCGSGDYQPEPAPTLARNFDVAEAGCGAGDQPETGLQGQVPMSARVGGFKGFNCNLEQTSATPSGRGEGIFGQTAIMRDKSGRTCAYAGGAFQDSLGTSVVDVTNPGKPVETTVLKTAAMLNPGEGLKVNEARGLLVSAYYSSRASTTDAPHGFDVYDVGTDCRYPQLLASTTGLSFAMEGIRTSATVAASLGGTASFGSTERIYGHEGGFAPDGLTYYVGDVPHGVYHAIDITDPTQPRLLTTFQSPGYGVGNGIQGVPHNASISSDGKRGYFVNEAVDFSAPGMMASQTGEWHNGFMVVDTSEIQARKPGGKIRFMKEVVVRDGAAQQMTIPVTIRGNPYVIAIGEMGTGQINPTGIRNACAAGLTPFAMAQFFYMGDETNPQLINKIRLEVNDPKNCAQITADVDAAGLGNFLYDVHMCSVDNRDNATTLACGYFKSGIRVYDIRDPGNIKEIAYFVPPAKAEVPGWCGSLPFLEASTGMLYSWCADSGVLALKFKNGVWPFQNSSTPAGKQL
jgi:hypothetical protein